MTPRRWPGELEQLLLLAVLRLGPEAHGPALRTELRERAGRRVGPGTLYPTLERLERKGLLCSELGDPTPERGGRAKRYFTLTPAGIEAARTAWQGIRGLAVGLEDILEVGGG